MKPPAPGTGDRHLSVRVQELDPQRFAVTIGDRTRHEVLAARWALAQVARQGESSGQTIERAMRFLLARESPEQILRRFRLEEVADYFPEFWNEMR